MTDSLHWWREPRNVWPLQKPAKQTILWCQFRSFLQHFQFGDYWSQDTHILGSLQEPFLSRLGISDGLLSSESLEKPNTLEQVIFDTASRPLYAAFKWLHRVFALYLSLPLLHQLCSGADESQAD